MIFLTIYLERWVDQWIITCQSVGNNFNDTLKKIRKKNLNRVIISQININCIKNRIVLLLEAVLGNIDILMVSQT